MKQTFEEKVRSMTAKQIIEAMIEGLKHPVTEIDMNKFGAVDNGVCYGCAATNTIAKIAGIEFTPDNIQTQTGRCLAVNSEYGFLYDFENAIDYLRRGIVCKYNANAERGRFVTIREKENLHLPFLRIDYDNSDLEFYQELADYQEQHVSE